MKLLAVDTASQSCGVALMEKDRLLAEMLLVSRETHSVHLMGMIREVSTRSKVPLASVDGFAVSLGPGSFTGLRIGISTLKGLAAALEKPLVGVSTLEALAWQHPLSGSPVVVLMDARRKEVYAARFRFDFGSLVRETPDQVRDPMAVIGEVAGPCLFVGSGAVLTGTSSRPRAVKRPTSCRIFKTTCGPRRSPRWGGGGWPRARPGPWKISGRSTFENRMRRFTAHQRPGAWLEACIP
jgi:tRNA threonylcarbamoyladenosine biosynthesis protein TsaB